MNSDTCLFFASVGGALSCFEVRPASGELRRLCGIELPAAVQYAWPDASGTHLYVVASDGGPPPSDGRGGSHHELRALRIDGATGAMATLGEPVRLPHRPIHVSLDVPGEHALIAYPDPSGLSVHRILPDGSLGERVEQPAVRDCGSYAHQIRVLPSNRKVVVVARGHDAHAGHAEVPGSLQVFDYDRGRLTPDRTIAPAGGHGFGPRHLDFHPTQPWVFLSLERQHQLQLFRADGDRLEELPAYSLPTLAHPERGTPRQMAGTVHVHPNGRHVYGAERCDHLVREGPIAVDVGGENTILVCDIEPDGRPVLVQREPTRGAHPRTFSIDPSGRLLIAGNKGAQHVGAGLDVYRILPNGRLEFLHTHEMDASQAPLFWSGFVPTPKETA